MSGIAAGNRLSRLPVLDVKANEMHLRTTQQDAGAQSPAKCGEVIVFNVLIKT